jgi:hypothetical protein
MAMQRDFLIQPGASRFAALLSDMLIRKAQAQTFGVYVDGAYVGDTQDGILAVAVVPGNHKVCIDQPFDATMPETAANCMSVDVGSDEVVVVQLDPAYNPIPDPTTCTTPGCNIAVGTITTESAFDNLALFESDKGHKVYVCHKGRTINVAGSSVGSSMSAKGHQVHGDSMGMCLEDAAPVADDGDLTPTTTGSSGNSNNSNNNSNNSSNNGNNSNNSNNSNNGNNGNSNRCNNGKPDKKGCSA